jgi:hypothetical protein
VSNCNLTIVLNGRPRWNTRTGPRTNCKRAHGAATMTHGPFQRFVRHSVAARRMPCTGAHASHRQCA